MKMAKLFLIGKKVKLFNLRFASLCTPVNNSSVLPRFIKQIPPITKQMSSWRH